MATKKKTTRRKKSTARRNTTTMRSASASAGTGKKTSSKSMSGRGSMRTTACLSGAFDGDINTRSHMHFAEGSTCRGNVQAPSVQIDGMMNGKVMAPNEVKLGSKAQIRGEIVTSTLVPARGAAFDGHCKLGHMRKAA